MYPFIFDELQGAGIAPDVDGGREPVGCEGGVGFKVPYPAHYDSTLNICRFRLLRNNFD